MKLNIISVKYWVYILCLFLLLIAEDNGVKCDGRVRQFNALTNFGWKLFNIIESSDLSNVNSLHQSLTDLLESNSIVREVGKSARQFTSLVIQNINSCFDKVSNVTYTEWVRSQITTHRQIDDCFENNFMDMLKCLSNNPCASVFVAKTESNYDIGGRKEYLDQTIYLSVFCEIGDIFFLKEATDFCQRAFNNKLYGNLPLMFLLNYIEHMAMILFNLKYLDTGDDIQLYHHFLMDEYNKTSNKMFLTVDKDWDDICVNI